MRKLRRCGLEIVFGTLPVTSMFFAFLLSTTSSAQDRLPDAKLDQDADRFVGCYELHLGRWWPWGMGEDTPLVTPPSRIELKLERGSNGFEKDELLIRQIPAAQDSRGSAFWVPGDHANVLLVWTNGFSGVGLRLTKNGNVLSGWAHAHFEVRLRPPHVAHVTAKAIPCPETR